MIKDYVIKTFVNTKITTRIIDMHIRIERKLKNKEKKIKIEDHFQIVESYM